MYLHILAISLIERLKQWDQWLFMRLNNDLANPFFDFLVPYLREAVVWAPLYLFIFVFVITNFKTKGWWWCLFFICIVAICDMVGSQVIKEYFKRPRPCYDPEFSSNVRFLLKHCSGSFSFTSNHAANHFGMAAFFYFTFRNIFPKWGWLIFLWATAVGFAQIYVGVHYPADIIGGALWGTAVAVAMARVFHKKFGFITFDNQPTVA